MCRSSGRHMQETTPAIEQNHRQVSETAIEGFESALPGDAISPVSGEVTAPDGDPEADRLRMIEALRQRAASATGDSLALGGEVQEPQGVNGLLTGLREAVRTQDHSRIKQAMNDLVALGDEAVERLSIWSPVERTRPLCGPPRHWPESARRRPPLPFSTHCRR